MVEEVLQPVHQVGQWHGPALGAGGIDQDRRLLGLAQEHRAQQHPAVLALLGGRSEITRQQYQFRAEEGVGAGTRGERGPLQAPRRHQSAADAVDEGDEVGERLLLVEAVRVVPDQAPGRPQVAQRAAHHVGLDHLGRHRPGQAGEDLEQGVHPGDAGVAGVAELGDEVGDRVGDQIPHRIRVVGVKGRIQDLEIGDQRIDQWLSGLGPREQRRLRTGERAEVGLDRHGALDPG